MSFKPQRLLLPWNSPPSRVYIHDAGFNEIYKSDKAVLDYFTEIFNRDLRNSDKFNYLLAIAWGDINSKEKVIDFFGYNGFDNWPGNPDVSIWVVRNGLIAPNENKTCCDSLVILGEEEKYRRTTKSLEDYMLKAPKISNFTNLPKTVDI